jgi:hypothetical protein
MMPTIKHPFKYNPLDISSIYLWDEKRRLYLEIPNADPSFGPISLEEYDFIRKTLRKYAFKTDTTTIMAARESLADLIAQSKTEKKSLLHHQRKAGSRARDLGEHPKTSKKQDATDPEKKIERREPEEFDIEL